VASPSGVVSAITLSNNGSGYTGNPVVTISAPNIDGGVQATASTVLSGGPVTAATIATGGSGYVTATVTFSAPQVAGGVTATGTATIVGGSITGITVVDGGSGYLARPTVTITGTGSGATAGTVTIGASSISRVNITNAGTGYTSAPTVTFTGGAGTGVVATAAIVTGGVKINNENDYINNWVDGEGVIGTFAAKYPGTLGNSITVSVCSSTAAFDTWAYASYFDAPPTTSEYADSVSGSNDEMHIVVLDADGRWTGSAGSILEKFSFVSKASDAKKTDGSNNYYKNVINSTSRFLWWTDHPVGAVWGVTAANHSFNSVASSTVTLRGGVDDLSATDGQLMTAWDLYSDDSLYDISLIPAGAASIAVAESLIALAESRADCVVYLSPQNISSGDLITNNQQQDTAIDQLIAYRNALPSTSYAVMDSGYKYQYDRYNDVYRWVPLNGDVAGLCARTDLTNDPWFSPGGMSRGQIKNVIKLAVQANKTDRDNLYKSGINPVVNFPGQGTVLFGDKTMLAKPSAFDRINVRRLFIVLEKAIATAAKFQLFEFNDPFTQAQFKNLVEPFLRDVQGRRGITDFVVKCDGTNNTAQVIDNNQFVADIFIKPARSINFITLNFVAARNGVNFSEIGA
jgi:hypothetical protein